MSGSENIMNSNDQHTVVVTGGSGTIGQALCEKLVSLNYNVVNIDRIKKDIPGVTQYPFDLNNSQIKGIMALLKPHAVIHLASENPQTTPKATTGSVYQINVADTINLLNYSVDNGVKYFIQSGYGDDTHNVDPIYKNSKNIIDQILPDYALTYGIKYASLKYPVVAGVMNHSKNMPDSRIFKLVRSLVKPNTPTLEIDQTVRSYIHIADVVDAHVSALCQLPQLDLGGVFDLVAQNAPLSNGYTDTEILDIATHMLANNQKPEWFDTAQPDTAEFIIKYDIKHIILHTIHWTKKHR
jgi:UDP-glucose 4-epimerase